MQSLVPLARQSPSALAFTPTLVGPSLAVSLPICGQATVSRVTPPARGGETPGRQVVVLTLQLPAQHCLCCHRTAETAAQRVPAGMPTPKLDASDEVAKVDQEFSAIVKQADELSSHSEKRIKELKAELEAVQAEKVLNTPELARAVPS